MKAEPKATLAVFGCTGGGLFVAVCLMGVGALTHMISVGILLAATALLFNKHHWERKSDLLVELSEPHGASIYFTGLDMEKLQAATHHHAVEIKCQDNRFLRDGLATWFDRHGVKVIFLAEVPATSPNFTITPCSSSSDHIVLHDFSSVDLQYRIASYLKNGWLVDGEIIKGGVGLLTVHYSQRLSFKSQE